MNVRMQGVLVTSFHGVTKHLTRSHLKEERPCWLMVKGLQFITVGNTWLWATAWQGSVYLLVPDQEIRTRVPIILVCNSQLNQLLPTCKDFPGPQDDAASWQRMWRHRGLFPFSFTIATFPFSGSSPLPVCSQSDHNICKTLRLIQFDFCL